MQNRKLALPSTSKVLFLIALLIAVTVPAFAQYSSALLSKTTIQ